MVTRLVGGLTPGDGADPRTFPAIWNVTADEIEAVQSGLGSVESTVTALGGTVATQGGIITANSTAIAGLDATVLSQGATILSQGSAISVIEAWDLDDLNDVTIGTAVSNNQVLAYSTAVSGWVNAAPSGKILQVVSASTTTNVGTISSTYADTTLSASITPSSASSKVLILVSQAYAAASSAPSSTGNFRVVRDSTVIRTNFYQIRAAIDSFTISVGSSSLDILDSPNTTSSVTYKTQVNATAGALEAQPVNSPSHIILLEVAG
jgi:hypothetical protein